MTEELKKHILKFAKPSDKELDTFFDLLEFQEVENKDFILKEGQLSKHMYFIQKGCFRSFFINKKGVEKIVNFGLEDWWMSDYDSFINQTQTNLNIQALEDSQVLRISKTNLDSILGFSLEFNRYFRVILEKVRIADQKRIQYIFNLSGKELYDIFCEKNPEFVQRVPQYMLASYLGFTPEFLSKIRALK